MKFLCYQCNIFCHTLQTCRAASPPTFTTLVKVVKRQWGSRDVIQIFFRASSSDMLCDCAVSANNLSTFKGGANLPLTTFEALIT